MREKESRFGVRQVTSQLPDYHLCDLAPDRVPYISVSFLIILQRITPPQGVQIK